MTHEQFRNEHDEYTENATPAHYCEQCGEAFEPGDISYVCGGDRVHPECFMEYVQDNFTAGYVALCMGYSKEVEGGAS